MESKGRYRDGKREGSWKFWREDGSLSERSLWSSDRRQGRCRRFHPGGQVEASGHYQSGLKQGLWERWHANGVRSEEANYREGRLTGTLRAWHSDGSVERFETWKGDMATVTLFYPGGSPKARGQWNARREKEGKWTFYRESGEVESEGFYRDGLRLAGN